MQCTELRFASLLSGGFTTMTVINPPDWKLANRTFVQCITIVFTTNFYGTDVMLYSFYELINFALGHEKQKPG